MNHFGLRFSATMTCRALAIIGLAILAGCAVPFEDIEREFDKPTLSAELGDPVVIRRPSLVDRHPPQTVVASPTPSAVADPLDGLLDEGRVTEMQELENRLASAAAPTPKPKPNVPGASAPQPVCRYADVSAEDAEELRENGVYFIEELENEYICIAYK